MRLFAIALRGSDWAWLLGLAAAALLVLGKDLANGALADADSAAHIMDGVLIHDWVMAGPSAWRQPMEFARGQYAHYPTLGIGQHYPPGFALVEAGFFAVFGISEATARLCVAFFGVILVVAAFLFVRAVGGDHATAGLSAGILLAFPATTLWGRQTMLEIPTLAVLVAAALAFPWYLARPTGGRLALLMGAAVGAILFKQTAVFLPCAIGMALLILAVRRRASWTHAALASAAAGCALLGVVLSFDDACLKTLSGYRTYPDPWSFGALTFYARTTAYMASAWVLVPAGIGAIFFLRRRQPGHVLLACWLAVAYIMVTAASLKVPRFFYVGLFPLAVCAAVGVTSLVALFPQGRLRRALPAAGVAVLAATGFLRPVRTAPDYGPVVAAHRAAIADQPVLFSGLRDGDFVFQVRKQLPWQTPLVIRGSKLFYTCTAGPDLDLVSYADTEDRLREMMRSFAFELVFVEREDVVGTPPDAWLRKYLAESGEYTLVASHVLAGSRCDLARTVDVYRPAVAMVRTVDHFDIPMPRTGDSIRVSLRRTATGNGSS